MQGLLPSVRIRGPRAVAWWALVVVCVSACGSASSSDATLTAARAEALTTELEAVADFAAQQPNVPSFVLRVQSKCLGYEYDAVRGFADPGAGTEVTPDHGFWIASITKTITAATVLRLVELGELRLDDTLLDHLPPDLVDRVHIIDGVSRGGEITIAQLLNHTSGLWDHASDTNFFLTVASRPGETWTPEALIDWALDNGAPYSLPGAEFHYSDLGYVLTGLIIESVTKAPLHDAYREHVFDPLEMYATHLGGYDERPGMMLAHPFFGTLDMVALDVSPTFDWAGGGLVSTVADLTRFFSGLFAGGLLSDHSLELMLRGVGPDLSGREYGFGIRRPESPGGDWRGHGGFWGSWAGYSEARGMAVAFNTSQSEAPVQAIAARIFAAVADLSCDP